MGSVIENEEMVKVPALEASNIIDLSSILKPNSKSALIILNQDITLTNMDYIWDAYELRICADGGANRLFDHFKDEEGKLSHIPDYIVGDLDSLRPAVGDWYQSHGTRLIKQETQYATDLTKALDLVEIHYAHQDVENLEINDHDGLITLHSELPKNLEKIQIMLLGALDGRFDHTVQSISTLLKRSAQNPNCSLYFISKTDLVFYVPQGLNYISYQDCTEVFHGATNGLLPLGGEITLSTHGFKWDVDNWNSSVQTSVSSSNRFVGEHGASIETNNPFVMSIELNFEDIFK